MTNDEKIKKLRELTAQKIRIHRDYEQVKDSYRIGAMDEKSFNKIKDQYTQQIDNINSQIDKLG